MPDLRGAPRRLAETYRTAVVQGRWLVLTGWVLLVGVVLALVPAAISAGGGSDSNDLLPEDSPAVQAAQRSVAQFGVPVISGTTVVLHDPDGLDPLTRAHSVVRALAVLQASQEEADARGGELPRNRVLAAVPVPLVSGDTAVTYLFMSEGSSLRGSTDAGTRYGDHFTETDLPGLQTAVTGFVPAQRAMATVLQDQLHVFELASLGVVLIVSLIFRSPVASAVVLAVAAGALLVYYPVLTWLAGRFGFAVPDQLQPVLAALLIGVVTDYCVLFFHSFRDQLARGLEVPDAVRASVAADSPVVAVAGLTVAVGTLALLVSPFGLFAALGPALAFTVLAGALASLLLTPALMAVLGHRLFRLRGRVPLVPAPGSGPDADRGEEGAAHGGRLSRGLVAVVTHRTGALLVVVLVTGALLAAAAPLARTTLSMSFTAGLPADDPVARGAQLLDDAGLRGLSAPTEVLVEGEGVVAQRAALERLQGLLASQPGVVRVIGPADLPGDDDLGVVLADSGDAARFLLVLDSDPLAGPAIADVRQVRDQREALAREAGLEGVEVSMTGQTRIASEVADLTVRSLFTTLLVAFGLQVLVLAVYLRSLVTPLLVLVASLVSMASALGLTVLVFQDLLGQPGLTFYAPFATAVLLLALGADYSVFALGGIWQEARVHPLRRAIALAVPRSAGAITAAGVILASTFALVALIPLVTFRQIAFTMAVGLLLDTLLVRPLLVPAALSLLGRFAGWPGRRTARTTSAGDDDAPHEAPTSRAAVGPAGALDQRPAPRPGGSPLRARDARRTGRRVPAVRPDALLLVQGGVSAGEEGRGGLTPVGGGQTRRPRHRVARAQPLQQDLRRRAGGVRQAHHELVPAPAPQQVTPAQLPLPAPGQLAQQRVPGGVPAGVVDLLEPVQVDHDDAEGAPRPPRLGRVASEGLLPGPAVGHAGQRVQHRLRHQAADQEAVDLEDRRSRDRDDHPGDGEPAGRAGERTGGGCGEQEQHVRPPRPQGEGVGGEERGGDDHRSQPHHPHRGDRPGRGEPHQHRQDGEADVHDGARPPPAEEQEGDRQGQTGGAQGAEECHRGGGVQRPRRRGQAQQPTQGVQQGQDTHLRL